MKCCISILLSFMVNFWYKILKIAKSLNKSGIYTSYFLFLLLNIEPTYELKFSFKSLKCDLIYLFEIFKLLFEIIFIYERDRTYTYRKELRVII